MVGPPVGQETLQFPTLVQVTEHLPVQVTSQLPTLVQNTALPSPITGAQSLTFTQV
jgi:hypothetical protein